MQDCKEPDIWIATTTLGSAQEARRLARDILERRLAACVQLGAIHSVYRWDGAVQEEEEVRLTMKTSAPQVDALRSFLAGAHPYSVAQFAAWPAKASGPYADWVRSEVS